MFSPDGAAEEHGVLHTQGQSARRRSRRAVSRTVESCRRETFVTSSGTPCVFRGTIWENIGYGRPGATMAESLEAAKALCETRTTSSPDARRNEHRRRRKRAHLSGGERAANRLGAAPPSDAARGGAHPDSRRAHGRPRCGVRERGGGKRSSASRRGGRSSPSRTASAPSGYADAIVVLQDGRVLRRRARTRSCSAAAASTRELHRLQITATKSPKTPKTRSCMSSRRCSCFLTIRRSSGPRGDRKGIAIASGEDVAFSDPVLLEAVIGARRRGVKCRRSSTRPAGTARSRMATHAARSSGMVSRSGTGIRRSP